MGQVGSGRERLIFALDVSTPGEAIKLVDELEGCVSFFKVGLELLMSGGMRELLDYLKKDKRVFVDLKLPSDITETVRRVVALGAELEIDFITLSATANPDTIAAALDGRGKRPKPLLLFVPFLSSLGAAEFSSLYGQREKDFATFFEERVSFALKSNCDGLIVSGDEIGLVREKHPDALLVCPAIRPSGSSTDDHKRFTTPAKAIDLGADYLVVGRPIRNATNRREAAEAIIAEIDEALFKRVVQDSRRPASNGSPGTVGFKLAEV